MHILDFVSKIKTQQPDPQKLKDIARTVGINQIGNIRLNTVKNTFLSDTAFDQYYYKSLSPFILKSNYSNYILSALINFGAHQLTMRRFPHVGNQILVHVGARSGEEFNLGVMNSIDLPCHLVSHKKSLCSSAFDFEELPIGLARRPDIFFTDVHSYLTEKNPMIGYLVISDIGDATEVISILDQCKNFTSQHCDIVIADNHHVVTQTCEMLHGFGSYEITKTPLQYTHNGKIGDDMIAAVLKKASIDYSSIIAPDDR